MVIAVVMLAIAVPGLASCIALGGPTTPPYLASISDPFKSVDFSDLPAALTFQAAGGQPMAYREYAPFGAQHGSVTLIHGSSASSESLHAMAKALAAAGYKVFALDTRGHGASGAKGHIRYIGQLDSALAGFVRAARPPRSSTLAGFSPGGGCVLRVAESERQSLFGSYLLLSRFLGPRAANERDDASRWVHVGIPRMIGLKVLNALGIGAFNALSVTAFALSDRARALLTPEYDFNLAMKFRPGPD